MDEISRNISILLKVDKSYIPKAEYVFRTFGKILGLQPNFYYDYTLEDIHVYYGPPVEDRRPIEIYYNEQAAKFFSKKNKFNSDLHFLNYRNENIPFLFSEPGQLFLYTAKSLEIKKDIIASAFFFLSCWQEYTQEVSLGTGQTGSEKQLKQKNETKKSLSLQRLWNFEDIPVVDRYCDIFQKALETMLPGYQKQMRLPDGKDFAASVSHLITNTELEDKDSNQSNESPWRRLLKRDTSGKTPLHKLISTSRLLSHIKRETLLKSTPEFFLPIDNPKKSTKQQNKELNSLINLIQTTMPDKSIGIFASDQITKDRVKKAVTKYAEEGFVVQGYYQKCWQLHYHSLIKELEDTGIKYDISISYCDILGYRACTSYPYFPFNIEENRPFSILEIPQVINNSLFDTIPKSRRYVKNHISYLLGDATLYRTHFGIIWNHSQAAPKNRLNFDYYLKLLKLILKRKAWLCSPHDIFNHWMDR